MKTFLAAAVIAALAASGALAGGAKRPESQRSDVENGIRQIEAQTKGKPYGDPVRQRDLDNAMRDDGTSSPPKPPKPSKPASSDGAKATPQ